MTNGSLVSDGAQPTSATAAARLADAVATRRPCVPVREVCDVADEVAWAYAVQRRFVATAWPGETVSGRKIGLTSPAVQAQLGVDQPDFGTLFASMALPSGAVVTDEFLHPRVEGEIAFLLGSDLGARGGELTLDDVRALRELVPSGVEGAIIGSALYKGTITLADALDAAGRPE